MITLYRAAACAACDEAETTLRELVVAHRVVDVDEVHQAKASTDTVWAGHDLPVIMDGDQVVSGQAALQRYLVELARELDEWRKYQTDACYVDDKGKTC